ncbi:hypothetical protein CH330_09630 [candidate division WOR-3 bacterium JGI_Cruoil_03_51_56]|uniref:Pseudouridine synthase n=1 Tax=candidate division WOR-3 bacterium JGI_Cruoil_03_51_56 TaxID=1973747 RepID=A0A235BR73_UNCW3|nr:MAG: hypothetical protein CH330_09630 [candidate division WOR-3 bacterium JGI_Cruoil_03_51_56]
MKPVRLQKYLASAGLGARRKCEVLIQQGKVLVNDSPAHIGMCVIPDKDRVMVGGRLVRPQTDRIVIMLNKPRGYLSTCRRGKERGIPVTELVNLGCRLFPVGRLDRDSEGLLVLTNDGELALRLTHPRYSKEKEYLVELDRHCDSSTGRRLRKGVQLEDGLARAVKVRCVGAKQLVVVLTQGRKRQVRRMFQAVGFKVTRLQRTRLAQLKLSGLKTGKWRRLTVDEVKKKLLMG